MSLYPHDGATSGAVNMLLRMEGATVLAGSIWASTALGTGWESFMLLFLIPDLSMLGYLGGSRQGALAYNAAHTYLMPAMLVAAGWIMGRSAAYGVAAVWTAHIGFDRMMGYGLKYPVAFGATHLGWRGWTQTRADCGSNAER